MEVLPAMMILKICFGIKYTPLKNYIPRLQRGNSVKTLNYSALKTTNYTDTKNPIPFNKVRFKVGFMYSLLCILSKIMVDVLTAVNIVMSYIQFYDDKDPGENENTDPTETLDGAKYGSRGTCISFEFSDDSDDILYIPGCMPRPSFMPGRERKSAFVRTIAKFAVDDDYKSAYRKDEGIFWEIVKGESKTKLENVWVGGQDLIDICRDEFDSKNDNKLEKNNSYLKTLKYAWPNVFQNSKFKNKNRTKFG